MPGRQRRGNAGERQRELHVDLEVHRDIADLEEEKQVTAIFLATVIVENKLPIKVWLGSGLSKNAENLIDGSLFA